MFSNRCTWGSPPVMLTVIKSTFSPPVEVVTIPYFYIQAYFFFNKFSVILVCFEPSSVLLSHINLPSVIINKHFITNI